MTQEHPQRTIVLLLLFALSSTPKFVMAAEVRKPNVHCKHLKSCFREKIFGAESAKVRILIKLRVYVLDDLFCFFCPLLSARSSRFWSRQVLMAPEQSGRKKGAEKRTRASV